MTSLRSPKVTALLDAIERVYLPVKREEFPAHLIEVVTSVVPAAVVTVDVIRSDPKRYVSHTSRPMSAEWRNRCAEVVHEHPAVAHINAGGTATVLKITDLITQRQFRRTALYNDVFRPVDVEYQIAVFLPVPEAVAGITMNRELDFSEEERVILERLRPHVARACVLADSLETAGRLRETPSDVFAWATKHALTRRELEVLHWVSEGKRDREIAMILGASARTVQTHVARILHKLGAETRTTAARMYSQRNAD
jgi:DNA-binding CsgD family transcriptional regulator